ncbi:tetratricopeptide repeat protein [Neolewinella agarilytica]|uniref:Tetratricopeptide repeat-containing protein n=1 Tax=Neolewinella agarilytica TaxID=478744 RepID=A0A1H9L5M6_9BACT|nr:tetratricopeptide repeat protein [Neolewinella agarilytica]SER06638.1 Tetratricopeptide repeat-containing protein [Neolewinella agarilytica]
MGRNQWISVAVASALLLLTYWGCPVRPPEMKSGFDRGPLEATGLESLIRAARPDLSPAQMATLASLEERLVAAEGNEEEKRDLQEQLAGEWYRAGQPAISGIYARQIAENAGTEESWSITATTFNLCLQRESSDEKTRQFCASQAEQAYQAAISLNPDNADNRINLALAYTDYPPQDNPMKGILMLRDLEKKYPENARVYITLGQLAIKTNQLDRAVIRLEKAVALAPDNPDAVCPLAKVYENLDRVEESALMATRCTDILKAIREQEAN